MIYFLYILSIITLLYASLIIWVVFGFIGMIKQGKKEREGMVKKISVIIPVRNEEGNIGNCLDSFARQNFKEEDYEIIVVNDHSTDNTIQEVKNHDLNNVSLYDLRDSSTKKEALKLGLLQAKHEIIATTDADCVVPENWLQIISQSFNDDTKMLLGPLIFNPTKGFLGAFQILDMLAIQGIEFGTLYYHRPILNNAANLAFTHKNYIDSDGYDDFKTPSGDDIFLLEKFKQKERKEIKGVLSKEFIVATKQESTLRGFINQRLRWASKSKYYSDRDLVSFSAIIFLQNGLQLALYLQLLFADKFQLLCITLLVTKWLIDFILLFLVSSFYRKKRYLIYFIPIQIIYPLYIILITLGSIFFKFEWKGREFSS